MTLRLHLRENRRAPDRENPSIKTLDASSDSDVSYRTEIIRKCIHFSSISIPIFYFFTPRETALAVSLTLTGLALVIDLGRYFFRPFQDIFYRLLGSLLRRHETDRKTRRLNGATFVLIAASISILVFPKLVAITSFLILILSDLAAALIGKRFGTRRFIGKSVQGSAAFFITALLVVLFLPKVEYRLGEYLIGAGAALVGTVVEAIPWEVDDNLSVPLAVGACIWAGYLTFYPLMDIHKFG